MRKALVAISTLVLVVGVFGLSLGIVAGKEFGGSQRLYVGATLNSGGIIGVGLDAYYLVTSFESLGEELQNISFLELDPLLLVNLNLGGISLYAGAGPIVLFNVTSFDFSLFSTTVLRVKAGVKLSLGAVSLILEGLTAASYNPIMTTGIYSLQAGVALGY